MSQTSIADARNHFPRLVQQAEAGEAVCITRRGRPVAVLLSTEAFERLSAPQRELATFLRDWRKEMQAGGVAFPEDGLFQGLRDNAPGRAVELA